MEDGAFIRRYELDVEGDPIPKDTLPSTSPPPVAAGSCRVSASFPYVNTPYTSAGRQGCHHAGYLSSALAIRSAGKAVKGAALPCMGGRRRGGCCRAHPGQSPPDEVPGGPAALAADGWLPWQPCLRPEPHLSRKGGKIANGQVAKYPPAASRGPSRWGGHRGVLCSE